MDIASSLLVPDWSRVWIRGNQGVVTAETGFKTAWVPWGMEAQVKGVVKMTDSGIDVVTDPADPAAGSGRIRPNFETAGPDPGARAPARAEERQR